MKQNTPMMGWTSRELFQNGVTADEILSMADALLRRGLADAGYRCLFIHDGWALPERDADGALVPDPAKFPCGIKALADALHEKGLFLGLYAGSGAMTPAGCPGTYRHELRDAETFGAWGVDYVEYNGCCYPDPGNTKYRFRTFAFAMGAKAPGVRFGFSFPGDEEALSWAAETGTVFCCPDDSLVKDESALRERITRIEENDAYRQLGCFCCLGPLAAGLAADEAEGASPAFAKMQFAFWCLSASPLMLACDVRTADDGVIALLCDPALLAIDQGTAARRPFFIEQRYDFCREAPIIARFTDDGSAAVGVFNFSKNRRFGWGSSFLTEKLGLPEPLGTMHLREVLTGMEYDSWNGLVNLDAEAHDCSVYVTSVK